MGLLPSAAFAGDVSGQTNEPEISFTDVNQSDWFYSAVQEAVVSGLFNGTGNDTFSPNGSMNRGMFMTVLGRLAGINPAEYSSSSGFSDVDEGMYYAPYIAWAVSLGITNGTGDGRFNPDSLITREQLAVFTVRYYEAYDIKYNVTDKASPPADIDSVSGWARDAVLTLWKAGILQGDEQGNINPGSNATRAEGAAYTVRVNKTLAAWKAVQEEALKKDKDETKTKPKNISEDTPAIKTHCLLSFNTNGGTAVPSQYVLIGHNLERLPVTQKDGATFLGWYTDPAFSKPFYAEDSINYDMQLYAKFAELEKKEQFTDDTFTLTDQAPELTFTIKSLDNNLTAAAVKSLLTLENIGQSDYVNLISTGGNGTYTISADGGFTEGASYKLALGDGLTFDGKAESYRNCTFTIFKNEVIELSLNDDLIYIPADFIYNIKRNGEMVNSLSVALIGNDSAVSGSFIYKGFTDLKNNDLLCIYTGIKPSLRNTEDDYSSSEVAYVKVTDVKTSDINGTVITTVSYCGMDEEGAKDVLFMPDSLPINTADLMAGEDLTDGKFTVADTVLDFSSYTAIGLDGDTTVDIGDFLVFYTESLASSAAAAYGRVTEVTCTGGSTTIAFDATTAEAIQDTTLDYYTKDDMSGEEMLTDKDIVKLEGQIENQAMVSGFAESSMDYIASMATQTDGFKQLTTLESCSFTDEDGNSVDPGKLMLLSSDVEKDVTVTADVSTDTQHFGKGLRCTLTLIGEFTIDAGDGGDIKIKLSASFAEEVKMSFNADGHAVWDVWGIFPYIKDYEMNANVDVYNFTGLSLQAKISTAEKDNDSTIIDFTELDVSEELKKLLGTEDEAELDAGVQELFELYGDMLETETDYISIVDKNLVTQKAWADPFCIIAYAFNVDFVISANINIWLGANFEYISGTRYNFWFSIFAKKAGSSTMDLVDEKYSFQFYVMGTIGIRAGLQFEFAVGLFSTDAASIGLGAEVGAYIELYGYFIYELNSIRKAGDADDTLTTNMSGALYLEFGIYLIISFKAQAGNEKFVYNPTLYENKWPLLYAGEQLNVYDFAYNQPESDEAEVIRDVKTYTLPDSYRSMARLDLKEGGLTSEVYPLSKYYYSLTNKNFAFDENTGLVTVTVPDGVQYMECDLTLTWKSDKLSFSKNDLTRTVHLVWTNLTTDELKEKYTVRVQAGNAADGYTTVWSTRVNKGVVPVLPEEKDILKLIGYGKNTVNNGAVDLRYTGYTGYDKSASIANSDQTYNFEVTPRKYTLTVGGVQKADGTTESRSFYARYGESFDLSSLAETGTAIAGTTYTRYLTTECGSIDGKTADSAISSAFAAQLLEDKYTYTAQYADNSCKVTYSFNTTDGTVINPVTIVISKGTTPAFDYSTYLINQGIGYIVKSWDNPIGKVTSDTVFTAVCGKPEGDPYQITFITNGGTPIDTLTRYPGAAIAPPAEPSLHGYNFAGWYTDAELTESYTFTTMPGENVTLYAKWQPKTYTVTFNAGLGTLNEGEGSITAVYDAAYDVLPIPVCAGFRFDGWFTAAVDGDIVSAEMKVSLTAAQTLYAHWTEKLEVKGINLTAQTYTYDKDTKAFIVLGTDLTGFTVRYKRDGSSSYSDSAVNAGTYTVQITRPEDNEYKAYSWSQSGGLIINRAVRDVTVDAPVFKSAAYSSITVNPVAVPNSDGIMMYAASTSNTPPTDGWTTSTTVSGLSESRSYYVFAKVAGGTNYFDAYSTGVLMQTTAKAGTSSVTTWWIKTGTDGEGGTSADVDGRILFYDGSESSWQDFGGHGNDFEAGDYDDYYVTIYREPWMVKGINIDIGKGGFNPSWRCKYVDLYVGGVHSNINVDADHYNEDFSKETTAFQRVITGAGGFDSWSGEYAINSESAGQITFAYDGTVTDKNYGTFNAYAKDDAPSISVSLPEAYEAEYGSCFTYSNYDLIINEVALYAKMTHLGVTQLVFTAKLSFPTRSTTTATAVVTKTITINRP
jgi:uncharacterized repeat protein (TIGR02543 family)